MVITRAPCPALKPYVQQLWAATSSPGTDVVREHVLPTGSMHLAFRLGGPALCVYSSPADREGTTLGHAVVGGARDRFHVRSVGGNGASVGALLAPGSALSLLGAPADALTGSHTPLDSLWGSDAGASLEQLGEASDPTARLDALERILLQRLDRATSLSPVVAYVLGQLQTGARVDAAVLKTGFSHRHVLTLFRQATGLAPKQYARILRMQSLLRQAAGPGSPGWALLALHAGFSDQSHFNREFLAYAGMTPLAWRRAGAVHPNHVPLAVK